MIKRRTIEELKQTEREDLQKNSLGNDNGGSSFFEDKIVIGIDPGTNFMGYAVVKVKSRMVGCLELGVIRLSKIKDPYHKLSTIFQRIGAVVDRYKPTEMALEAPFYGKNVQSMLKLGRAQGVAMAAGLSRGIDVFEYSPLKVKQSVTGVGRASKEQVATLLGKMFADDFSSLKLDATDALAVAICHLQSVKENRLLNKSDNACSKNGKPRSSSSWTTFLSKNKDRII